MARTYAVILALLGMLVISLRGLKNGTAIGETVTLAVTWMALLAVIGMIVGTIAENTIDESVRVRFQAELDQSASRKQEEQGVPN